MTTPPTFTGRRRNRHTRWTVRFVDRLARGLIAVGGIGTVLAVSTVCVFLVWVALPLFLPAKLGAPHTVSIATPTVDTVRIGTDEYQALAWTLSRDGQLRVVRLSDGAPVEERSLFAEAKPTAWAFAPDGREAVCGFADGTLRSVRIDFTTTFPAATDLPSEALQVSSDAPLVYESGLLARTKEGQLRLEKLDLTVSDPISTTGEAPVVLVDRSTRSSGQVCCSFDAAHQLRMYVSKRPSGLALVKPPPTVTNSTLPYEPPTSGADPKYLLLSGVCDNLYLIWEDGQLQRYDLRDPKQPRLAERVDLVPEDSLTLTRVCFLPGKTTLLAGDTSGRVRAWFPVRSTDPRNTDGLTLVAAHELAGPAAAVTAIAPSPRTRTIAVAYADDSLRAFQVTNERRLIESTLVPADQKSGSAAAADAVTRLLCVPPKDDAIVACADGRITLWLLEARYAEVSFAALFRPVWYEGYHEPAHVWQSSGGSDNFEPKLGMLPLVFGTMKAAGYSLLFAVPLALFAAIYTSEFLHARTRARIKPTIEMMASLPSVVLGFVAAIVVAPVVEAVIPAVLAGIFVVPFSLLLAAHLWQLLPQRLALSLVRFRFALICATLPLGVLLSIALGPTVERLLFAGDLRAWLDGQLGSGVGGWVLLFLPLSALATATFIARRVNPQLRQWLSSASREQWALVGLLKFLVATIVAVGGAVGVALLLDSLHFDPRGMVLDTYVQRNALVVGFVMGFAIVPLIYTVADDALATVPAHLRSASLAVGATPWQTAVRVIVPTAMSGLFSAVMIGLGRAVGETMIVLMAAGNTPIMDWNVFNGFQTLSASIATELPEAVQGSSHYRTLFVAALTLFVVTFVVNTIAEGVRLRFRRRAYEL